MDVNTALTVLATYAGSKELLSKLLGPTADYLGGEIQQWAQRRLKTVGFIVRNAESKLGDGVNRPGRVPPKVLKEILGDGSFADNELAIDYFGGVLASSRSDIERDDRGAYLAKLVGQLSGYQLRTHYLFYSELKRLYDGVDSPLGTAEGRAHLSLYVSMEAYASALEFTPEEDQGAILLHTLEGLGRFGLIDDPRAAGSTETVRWLWKDAPGPGIVIQPSQLGSELFVWAQGSGRVDAMSFLDPKIKFNPALTLPVKGLVLAVTQAPPSPDLSSPG